MTPIPKVAVYLDKKEKTAIKKFCKNYHMTESDLGRLGIFMFIDSYTGIDGAINRMTGASQPAFWEKRIKEMMREIIAEEKNE